MGILYLVGARASGKTTVGKTLAKKLGLPFADTDQLLLESAGRTVDQIVEAEGWPGFRQRESAALREVTDAHKSGCVVSTGGGMVLAETNRTLMRQRGMVVFLDAPEEVLAERLGMETTAEGTETRDEFEAMRRLGCTQTQGWHFGRPMALEETHRLLDRNRPMVELVDGPEGGAERGSDRLLSLRSRPMSREASGQSPAAGARSSLRFH